MQAGGGDDAQRPLGTAQQVAQIIAAVVLFERCKPVEDAAVGERRLDPRDQRAHRTVAQDLGAAGVC